MKKDESISDLQTRFTHIINNLHALGKVVENEQQIGKVMRNKPVKTKGKDQQPSTKRAYIAWNDNDEDSSEDSEDEEANLCLMANTDSESESEVSTTSNPSYDELHDAFNELHAEYGHMVFNCKLKKLANRGWKQIWKVKTQAFETNPPGPNLNWVHFTSMFCTLEHKEVKSMKLTDKRVNNIYMIDFDSLPANDICCLLSNADENWLWHKRVAHIHMDHLNRLVSKQLVLGLPNRKFSKDRLCDSCERSKLVKSSFPPIDLVQTNKVLQLVHMDLFGPSQVRSFGGNLYGYVLVDDYSRFTWTFFLAHKKSEPIEPSEPIPPTNLDCVEPIREDDLPKEWKFTKNHPIDNIIGEVSKGVSTRKSLREFCNLIAFVSQI
uniref:Uncharacterized protein LOC101514411 n=1 Tax=Cicer arietinum TaxID=3827 RepID=A0A1S2XLK5_CICAR|nr:uncharacterized protein LOC101514411 [Cicer arietinum]